MRTFMSLPHLLGVGAGLVGAASGTWLGVKTGHALERNLSADEKADADCALTVIIPAARLGARSTGSLDQGEQNTDED